MMQAYNVLFTVIHRDYAARTSTVLAEGMIQVTAYHAWNAQRVVKNALCQEFRGTVINAEAFEIANPQPGWRWGLR